jgi:SAM-dependent methyltransferase
MDSSNHEAHAGAATARWLPMKSDHLSFLASARWAQMLERDLLPWLRAGGELGHDVLEIGPGPGLTTDLLRSLAANVTVLELDESLVASLRARLAGTRVEVVHADATQAPFAAERFSAVACFHMLHHVPSAAQQDAVFAEVARVLRPGGLFMCADPLDIEPIRAAHHEHGETYIPLDPSTLPARLQRAGFDQIELRAMDYQLLVRAVR